jgi:tetratricopeptide (TPR) repeat protein
VETSHEFRITHATADTIEHDIGTLLRLWEAQWGSRKGERLASIQKVARVMFMDCFNSGLLFLPVLWKGSVPIGALACLIDMKNKSLLFYMGGRMEGLNNPAPGLVLHAYSIRTAIAAGFATYDFLRGNEAYKYSLGAEERHIKCIIVRTESGRNLGNKLDRRSLPLLLRQAIALHRTGRLDEAERAYRQASDLKPGCTTTLYHFGELMVAKGNHHEAEKLFKAVVAVEPAACKAWSMLAHSLRAQARFGEAAAAYQEIVRRQPTFPHAYYNLGVTQLKLGQHRDAVASFEAALDLQPDGTNARIAYAKAIAVARSAVLSTRIYERML